MDRPPAYLLWYFLRIRGHSGERDYLVRRFDGMDEERVALEAKMIRELHKHDYLALPDESKFVDKLFPDGSSVPHPTWFFITPAGHYALRELAVSLLGKVSWTLVAAILGGLAAIALGNLG